jgi:hypothetical protein
MALLLGNDFAGYIGTRHVDLHRVEQAGQLLKGPHTASFA